MVICLLFYVIFENIWFICRRHPGGSLSAARGVEGFWFVRVAWKVLIIYTTTSHKRSIGLWGPLGTKTLESTKESVKRNETISCYQQCRKGNLQVATYSMTLLRCTSGKRCKISKTDTRKTCLKPCWSVSVITCKLCMYKTSSMWFWNNSISCIHKCPS